MLFVLVALLVVPYLAEQIVYSITRGEELAKAEVAREELAQLPDAVNRYRLAAKVIGPSVVGVETIQLVGGATADEWSPFGRQPRVGAAGEGSGVIVDEAGFILTNTHVVSQATQVTVRLSDGRTSRARIIGADPLSDLAVLRIDAGKLTPATWGDSGQLEVGDPVLAVGNPFGLAHTVTAGIVSAKDRRVDIEHAGYRDFLQTDAAVNPGNSGGPLVNLKGEVVGINTAIVGQAYQGISFAIPSRLAQEVYNRLKTTGKVTRGWLGVAMQDLTEPLAEKLGVPEARGAIVASVVPDSPAKHAGIQRGDVIVKWGEHAIVDSNDLRSRVAQAKVDSKVPVTLYRDGQKREVTVAVSERPAQFGQ